jgi:elongation factor P
MYNASDLRKGLKIEIDGDPYIIVDFQFVKPGKGQALYRCKIKNLKTGGTQEKTYRSVDKIDEPNIEEREMIYSYPEGERFTFMDKNTYEEMIISKEALGDQRFYLKEDIEVTVLFHNGNPIEVTLPYFVEHVIMETEPGLRGDTATNVLKPAKLANGHEVQVPLFINEGDTIRIDTRTGEYAGRVT